jgi:hypothetical protein
LFNPFPEPMSVRAAWATNTAWSVDPASCEIALAPGAERLADFHTWAAPEGILPLPVCRVEWRAGRTLREGQTRLPFDLTGYRARHPFRRAIPRASAPPTLNGRLDDPCWQRPPDADSFACLDLVSAAPVDTAAWMAFDDDALYVAWRCGEPSMDRLVCSATNRDGQVWNDDSVELFLASGAAPAAFVQFVFNSAGVVFDTREKDRGTAFDGQARVIAATDAKEWRVETAIPWKALGLEPPARDRPLRFLLARNRAAGKPVEGPSAGTPAQFLQCPPVDGGNFCHWNFGELVPVE